MDGMSQRFAMSQILRKRSAMKTITISILVLVALPIHLMAQENNDFKPKVSNSNASNYYAKRYLEIESSPNHIVDSVKHSNRKGASPLQAPKLALSSSTQKVAISSPQVSAPAFSGGQFSNLKVKPLESSSRVPTDRIALAPYSPLENNNFKPFNAKAAMNQEAQAIEILSPEVAPQEFGMAADEIVRPTPQNSELAPAAEPEFSQPSVSDTAIVEAPPIQPERPPVDDSYNGTVLVEPEAVSLDHLQMAQRGGSWEVDRPNTMRHVTDHFSPGGEPFAQRTITGRANYFGVDRRECCDEWGFCNCGSGLKANPGHLGIPWLRNCKEPCDSVDVIRGRHRAKKAAKRAADCGCPQCVNQ